MLWLEEFVKLIICALYVHKKRIVDIIHIAGVYYEEISLVQYFLYNIIDYLSLY